MTRFFVAGGLLTTAFLWYPALIGPAAAVGAVLLASLLVWRPRPRPRPVPVLSRLPTRYERDRKWSVGVGAGLGLFGPFIGLGFWRRRR